MVPRLLPLWLLVVCDRQLTSAFSAHGMIRSVSAVVTTAIPIMIHLGAYQVTNGTAAEAADERALCRCTFSAANQSSGARAERGAADRVVSARAAKTAGQSDESKRAGKRNNCGSEVPSAFRCIP